jgi:hypothetical protein
MAIWLYIVAAMMVQELAAVAAALGFAYHLHVNIFLVHGVWLVATTIDAMIGFECGRWVHRRYGTSTLARHATSLALAIERRVNVNGRRLTLALFGFLNFPYVNGFIGSWLNLSFADTLLFTLVGNAFWYLSIVGAVTGIGAITADPRWIAAVAIVLAVGLAIAVKILRLKKR